MKHYLRKSINYIALLLFTILTFIIFSYKDVSAQNNAICRVAQGSKYKDLKLPFTWYTSTVISRPMSTSHYTVTSTEITNANQCNKMKYTPTMDVSTWTQKQYGYQISGSTDYEKSLSITSGYFGVALDMIYLTGPTITGAYIAIDETPPTLVQDGWSGAYITNIDNPIDINAIKSLIKAVDDTDGIVEVYITNDSYSDNKHIVGGPYDIVFGAKDAKGNDAELTIQVYVKDTTNPTLTGQSFYENYMSTPLDLSTFKNNLIPQDNYDKNPTIAIIENNWSANRNKIGTYTIVYQAIDSATNKSNEFTVSITNYDDIKPTLTGETSYNVSNKSEVSLEYIKSQLLATDNSDINPTIEVSLDNYTLNKTIPGSYEIIFNAIDTSKNSSESVIVLVTVFDNIAPIFYISGKFIAVDSTTLLSLDQLKEIVAVANNIDYSLVTNTAVNYNYYSENYNVPGEHKISLTYTLASGEQNSITQNIKVINPSSLEETPAQTKKEEPKLSFFQKIWKAIINFFATIWNYIKYFFSFKWLQNLSINNPFNFFFTKNMLF